MPDQGFEAEPDGFSIGRRATDSLRVVKGGLINMQRLFHTSDITIPIQQKCPYAAARAFFVRAIERGFNPFDIPGGKADRRGRQSRKSEDGIRPSRQVARTLVQDEVVSGSDLQMI